MLPPTQSLQHQNMKLAEFLNTTRISGALTPAYSGTTAAFAAQDQDPLPEDDADDDPEYPTSWAPPINISIDASLKIDGDANTVVLPPSPSPPSSPSSSTNLSAMTAGSRRTYQNGRVEKLTTMVLSALKDAGVFNSGRGTDDRTMTRPIEIKVDAGIVLKGSKNTVCSGLPKLLKATTGAGANSKATPEERSSRVVSSESRKRRACSEPPEVSTPKKGRVS